MRPVSLAGQAALIKHHMTGLLRCWQAAWPPFVLPHMVAMMMASVVVVPVALMVVSEGCQQRTACLCH